MSVLLATASACAAAAAPKQHALLAPDKSSNAAGIDLNGDAFAAGMRGWIASIPSLAKERDAAKQSKTESKRAKLSRESNRTIPEHECKQIVLLAGMPRTGSTLQMKLTKRALEALGEAAAISRFWDYPAWTEMDEEETSEEYEAEEAEWAQLDENSTVLYKSHRYEPQTVDFCPQHHVLTQHRELLNEFKSAAGAFDLDITQDAVATFIKANVEEYKLWLEEPGVLDQEYETVAEDTEEAFHQIVRWLCRRMDREYPDPMPELGEIGEANPSIPSSGSLTSEEDVLAVMRPVRERWEGTDKDPTLIGLRWGFD